MNYGGEAADQIVRYSIEGTEMVLKLSGKAAVNLAMFITALLKDQKKTRGKTRMVRMLREERPFKFFKVDTDRMKEFAKVAKSRGLLFVSIKDKTNPAQQEIMVFADDAAKIQRVLDTMGLDYLEASAATGVSMSASKADREPAAPVKTETVETEQGEVAFEIGDSENEFTISTPDETGSENFINAGERGTEERQTEKIPSEPSSRSNGSSPKQNDSDERPSVRKELKEIQQEQKQKAAAKKAQPEKAAPAAVPKKKKTKESR